jgi:UDP-glucose 4-epimerase
VRVVRAYARPRGHGLAHLAPEADDDALMRAQYSTPNAQANELLYRRVDIEDVVSAHLLAIESAGTAFRRYIISATAPFTRDDLPMLRRNLPTVMRRLFPDCEALFKARGWKLFDGIDRVYVNERARTELGWQPKCDFHHVLDCLRSDRDFRSTLARTVGVKGYHQGAYADGLYPVA